MDSSSSCPDPGTGAVQPALISGQSSEQQQQQQDQQYQAALTDGCLAPRAASWPDNAAAVAQNADFPPLRQHASTSPNIASQPRKPSDAGLSLQTNVESPPSPRLAEPHTAGIALGHDDNASPPSQDKKHRPPPLEPSRPPLFHKHSWGSSAASPGSSVSSPALTALGDVTPLPSPISSGQSPEIWRKVAGRPHSSSSASVERERAAGFLTPTVGSSSPGKKKVYPNLGTATPPLNAPGQEQNNNHQHTRSISEFTPDPLQNVRPRTVTGPSVISPPPQPSLPPGLESTQLQRETYLARERGSVDLTPGSLPSPPPSNLGTSDEEEDATKRGAVRFAPFVVKDQVTGKKMSWQPQRILGTGSFSEVFLASPADTALVGVSNGSSAHSHQWQQSLVAIKVVSHHSGNDDARMDTSIKREIEILQHIIHPCLPQLYAVEDNDSRALLVMNYCAGGDLFELASQHRSLLRPAMIRRIFAELVGAVLYLHSQYIVHRDIKLENVLLNLSITSLRSLPCEPQEYPHPLITLTDLGLSKHIPPPPASPLLTHPCGSVDYAAPEILLGQPYDGRATDAWALGVLLYALMEGRLPFDPLPEYTTNINGTPTASRRRKARGTGSSVKHRIARCDWLWCELGDEDGEWLGSLSQRGQELQGARECVEGLLKKVGRGRWSLDKVGEAAWVRDGIRVEGGLRVAAPS